MTDLDHDGWNDLVSYSAQSIYKNKSGGYELPARMAMATDDTANAIIQLDQVLVQNGGRLVISDGYRSYEAQKRAYEEYVASVKAGRPIAKRSKPGNSMHNSGRAIDFSLDHALKSINLGKMWDLMKPFGWYPIIDSPNPKANEAWHIECRGPFQKLYERSGYTRMVRAAVCDVKGTIFGSVEHDDAAHLQYQLCRLVDPNIVIDGEVGRTTIDVARKAANTFGITDFDVLSNRGLADRLALINPGQYNF